MPKSKFQQEFPDYPIIPSKVPRWRGPLLTGVAVAAVGGLVIFYASQFGRNDVPVPVEAGFNKNTLPTLRNLALIQSSHGQYAEAVKNFATYFGLGGQELEAIEGYAAALFAVGQIETAEIWAKKAVALNPQSKAARFLEKNQTK